MDIGKRIRTIRKSRNLTLDKVHELTKISRATLSLWETNKTRPTLNALERWAEGIGIEVWDIFFDASEFEPTPDEMLMLEMFRQLSSSDQTHLLSLLKTMSKRRP
ncbi:helix-turn-helix domain-containing protein [Paenibacillus solani]|uniref:helix-turn-helix domain-containing protein n=1 Tax=Paenibacillus solani TaxID=1705565 RepID=UPI003D29F1D5